MRCVCGQPAGTTSPFCDACLAIWKTHFPSQLATPPVPSMEPQEQSETVVAHRIWRWTRDDGLIGPSKVPWKSSFMRAVCATKGHPAPYGWLTGHETTSRLAASLLKCWCGVNAYKLTEVFDPADLTWAVGLDAWHEGSFTDCLAVVGIVELGGIVDEYERGYRAEYGQIQELTVLTGMPVDLTPLEEKYEVPVRAMSYEDWRREWELTYGRDRETSETDQDSETGAAPGAVQTGSFTWTGSASHATITGTAAGSLWTNAQLDRLLNAVKNTPEPSGWRKLWWRTEDWWGDAWDTSPALTLALGFCILLEVGALTVAALGLTGVLT